MKKMKILMILMAISLISSCNQYNYLRQGLEPIKLQFDVLVSEKQGAKWINKTSIDSLKVGFWVYHEMISECLLNKRKYSRNIPFECLQLDSIGCYDKGMQIGNWYYFNQEGCVNKVKFKKRGLPNLKLYEVDSIFKQGKYRKF